MSQQISDSESENSRPQSLNDNSASIFDDPDYAEVFHDYRTGKYTTLQEALLAYEFINELDVVQVQEYNGNSIKYRASAELSPEATELIKQWVKKRVEEGHIVRTWELKSVTSAVRRYYSRTARDVLLGRINERDSHKTTTEYIQRIIGSMPGYSIDSYRGYIYRNVVVNPEVHQKPLWENYQKLRHEKNIQKERTFVVSDFGFHLDAPVSMIRSSEEFIMVSHESSWISVYECFSADGVCQDPHVYYKPGATFTTLGDLGFEPIPAAWRKKDIAFHWLQSFIEKFPKGTEMRTVF